MPVVKLGLAMVVTVRVVADRGRLSWGVDSRPNCVIHVVNMPIVVVLYLDFVIFKELAMHAHELDNELNGQ